MGGIDDDQARGNQIDGRLSFHDAVDGRLWIARASRARSGEQCRAPHDGADEPVTIDVLRRVP